MWHLVVYLWILPTLIYHRCGSGMGDPLHRFWGSKIDYFRSLCKYRPQTKFAKVMFLHVSVCPGRLVSQHALQVSSPHLVGRLRGLPKGDLQAHTQGGRWRIWSGGSPGRHPGRGVSGPTPRGVRVYHSIHWGRHTSPSPSRRLLLECILVSKMLASIKFF